MGYHDKESGRRTRPWHRRQKTEVSVARLSTRTKADISLKKIFAKIGVPEERPFEPDPFQLDAVRAIEKADCLVTAPTGSGKTWIAEQAIARLHDQEKRVWYATPLKALSNAKYAEFADRFGAESVGILTGDRKENPDAPIVVGTTEILRNHLYDVMREGVDFPADLVVLDEAHFLGDPDRGVVWEEVMIYLPTRINLLMLSATISNAKQIACWLESIRGKQCIVVDEKKRPVSLYPLFLHPTGELSPLAGKKELHRKVARYLNAQSPQFLSPSHMLPPVGDIIHVLRRHNLLPAIFFVKSRADCNAALDLCTRAETRPDLDARLQEETDEFLARYPYLATHKQLQYIREARVAAHHAGQLPGWKLLVEKLMCQGLLEAVFATSTVAAGVNFPARTIVLFNSDRYNGHDFVPLDATEFHQMTGRAGRRGMDNIGFAVAVPGKFMDIPLINRLISSPPEPVFSEITVNFSMVLNLLLSHTPKQVREVFEKSFATYVSVENRQKGIEKRFHNALEELSGFLPARMCASPLEAIGLIRKRRTLQACLADISRQMREMQTRIATENALVPGRLFLDKKRRVYCVVRPPARDGACLCCLMRQGRGRRPKLRKILPKKVGTFFDTILSLPKIEDPHELCGALSLEQVDREKLSFLDELRPGRKNDARLGPLIDRERYFRDEFSQMACNGCPHFKLCYKRTKARSIRTLINDLLWMSDSINAVRMRLWTEFERHVDFLKKEGFVSKDDELTKDGVWTSQLRLDQPLLIAEGLRLDLFPKNDPATLSALIAPFVCDRDLDIEVSRSLLPETVSTGFSKMVDALAPLIERKKVCGFATRPIPFWTTVAIYRWAKGMPWEEELDFLGIADGDLAALVIRTADNLRQIASIGGAYPEISRTAREAVALILREPVLVD